MPDQIQITLNVSGDALKQLLSIIQLPQSNETNEIVSNEETPKLSYYQRNKEKVLAKRKLRYEAKKDELRAYQREYIRNKRALAA